MSPSSQILAGVPSKIVEAAKDNPALQESLERAKVLYELSKKDDDGPVMHHPV